MATPIEIKSQLIIEQIKFDAGAKRELDRIKISAGIVPGSGTPDEKAMDSAAKRQGFEKGEKAKPNMMQGIASSISDPTTLALNGLVKVLEIGLQNSKIANMLQKKVNEALGLLVDLILLPFLPILIWVLINLFKAVLWLGDMWKKFVAASGIDKVTPAAKDFLNPNKEDGTPKTTLDRVIDFANLVVAWERFIQIDLPLVVLGGLAYLIIEIGKQLWNLGTDIGKLLADGLWSIMPQWMKDNLKKAQVEFDNALIEIGKWWAGVLEIPAQLDKAWAEMMLAFDELHKMIDDIPKWFNELGPNISKWFDEQFALLTIELDKMGKAWDVFWGIVGSGLRTFINVFIGLLNMGMNALRKVPGLGLLVPEGAIPTLAGGGTVSKTGIAVVHEGETVVPAGKGNTTFNFYGYQDDMFIKKVRDITRQDATRYSQ